MKKTSCILCGKPLKSGIIINGIGICESCEKRLVGTKAGNDFYNYYINCIKKTIVHTFLKERIRVVKASTFKRNT